MSPQVITGQMIQKFREIFTGLEIAYGQTKKTDVIGVNGKHQTKSFTIKQPPTKDLWQAHLDGVDPALGIVPINQKNECKWGCIDIDDYSFNHQQFIKKLNAKKIPLILFRSKSGGAHAFLFTKTFVAAELMRAKLKMIASLLGYAKAEIFPKQDYLRADRGDTGSFLNLPYHNAKQTLRYAFGSEGQALDIEEFFGQYDKQSLTEDQLKNLSFNGDSDDMLKGAPPCLVSLANEGIPNGHRNNAIYNFGVYLKKRFPDKWQTEIFKYNDAYCKPPLDKKEIDTLIKSIDNKDYQYKCKEEPIHSFCDSKACVFKEFGVGDGAPGPEITEIRKYPSDPPIYFVTVGGDSVEVDTATLHDPDKFSMACMDQIKMPMMPVGKTIWRKMLIKLFKNCEEIEAPQSTKIDVQLTEILADFINKAPGKKMEDIRRGLAFTEDGISYFKFKDFWKYLLRGKTWPDKTYPKQKTNRLLEQLFSAKEVEGKIDKVQTRYIQMETIKLSKPNVRTTKLKEAPFA